MIFFNKFCAFVGLHRWSVREINMSCKHCPFITTSDSLSLELKLLSDHGVTYVADRDHRFCCCGYHQAFLNCRRGCNFTASVTLTSHPVLYVHPHAGSSHCPCQNSGGGCYLCCHKNSACTICVWTVWHWKQIFDWASVRLCADVPLQTETGNAPRPFSL